MATIDVSLDELTGATIIITTAIISLLIDGAGDRGEYRQAAGAFAQVICCDDQNGKVDASVMATVEYRARGNGCQSATSHDSPLATPFSGTDTKLDAGSSAAKFGCRFTRSGN
jgi:hypothetical protein